MVKYKVRSFYEKDTGTAGADVIIFDDQGDVVDTLLITTESTYNDLIEQLEGIDERYLDRTDVLEILQNTSNEIVAINATLLNGHNSDYFAPNNHNHNTLYAPLNHVDNVSSSSVQGHTKIINNLSSGSYRDGEALSAYQGKILADRIDNLLNKSAWKTYRHWTASNGWSCKVEYNNTHARCIIADPANVSFSATQDVYVDILKDDLWIRPYRPVVCNFAPHRRLVVSDADGKIYKQSLDQQRSATIYCQIDWTHRGAP